MLVCIFVSKLFHLFDVVKSVGSKEYKGYLRAENFILL